MCQSTITGVAFFWTYGSNGAHSMVNTAGSKSALDNLKTTTLAEDEVASGHANILEANVAMAVRGVIVAVDVQHAVDGNALGFRRDQNNGLLLVGVLVVGIALAHDDVD